ncbi:MAG: YkvA family protein [Methylococcus sp.]
MYGTLCNARSPIDLIPDFIPAIGFLDDLLRRPSLIARAIQLAPKDMINTCRETDSRGHAH